MTSFKVSDEDTLDYTVIRDGGITIYRNLDYLEEDIQWLREKNYRIHRLDCSDWNSENAMHESMKAALSFPDYYGMNFNALNDVIDYIDVSDDGGTALVLLSFEVYADRRATSLPGSNPDQAKILLDILSWTSHEFLLTGRRFLTMIQSNDPSMHYEKLGCRSAFWNRREWLNKDRGL
jgi:Barstar (barnase inhibitor)